jgi:hypothetical protein
MFERLDFPRLNQLPGYGAPVRGAKPDYVSRAGSAPPTRHGTRETAVLGDGVYTAPWWFDVQARTCLVRGDTPWWLILNGATLPLRRSRAFGLRQLASLTSEFTAEYLPCGDRLALDSLDGFAHEARAAADVIRLDCLPHPDPLFTAFDQSLAAAGWLRQSWFHFGSWYLPTAGLSSERYLEGRPVQLRRNLKRSLKQLAQHGARFRLTSGGPELEHALRQYETVYRASWKPPEIHPEFVPALAQAAAAAGALRLGICEIGGIPAAAQIWLVLNGRATIFKIAYDERFRSVSVGSALTWWMMRAMLDEEQVREVDFGRGDDHYKRWWLSERRERWGLLAFNPLTPGGLALAARHIGGRWAKRRLVGLAQQAGLRSFRAPASAPHD